jgi:uncharacterized protein YndB with AHSA1/START domain
MAVERQVEIERPVETVFEFIADARNDPRWCATVSACRQSAGDGPGPGAHYVARHKPTPFHRTMERSIEVVDFEAPTHVTWRQEDENGLFKIGYRLESTASGTRFVQSDEIEWKVPGPIGRVAERLFVRRHIGQQMAELKLLLEAA